MSIANSDIKYMKAQIVSDSDGNGGRMSDVESAPGVKNNVWPDVPASERKNGSTKYRKVFIKIANADNLKMVDARIFVDTLTPGGDRVLLFSGTQTDTQADVSGVSHQYSGAATLDADIPDQQGAGGATLVLNTENGADLIFRTSGLIRITNKTSVDDLAGTEEFLRIGTTPIVWNGSTATIVLRLDAVIENVYSAANTRVSSVIEAGDIWGNTSDWQILSAAGKYGGWNGSGSIPTLLTDLRMVNSIAGCEQTWTITFSSATTFSCVGDTAGSVGGGTINADFAPNNDAYFAPYFTLASALFSGTWANGDVLRFKTHPAAYPIWEKRIIPPNTPSLSGNKVIIGISGESE
ncbi:MAG: hypothetical protein HQL99_10875 [Magnetococcales bacterium]|nr:hypothetical protein [Magnetococcales bacterium]